jgi:hypothetical protein
MPNDFAPKVGMILSRGCAKMLAGSLAREVEGAGASP